METNLNILSDNIIAWIKEYAISNKRNSLVIGVSGGVDSGLVSTLCAKTGLQTYVLSMPIHQESDQLERARNHCKWLTETFTNVKFIEKDLTIVSDTFKSLFGDFSDSLTNANSRSRIRMVSLYQVAGATGGLVVGTGNKVEDFGVGFYTKYGDGGVDLSPIADLTKSEVRSMARAIGVPEYIVTAIPTDGLWDDNRTDEHQIGASYEELEWAMAHDGCSSNITERQNEILNIYNAFNKQNKHKMLPVPTFKKYG